MEFLKQGCLPSATASDASSLAYPLIWPELTSTDVSDQESFSPSAESNEINLDPEIDCLTSTVDKKTTWLNSGQLGGSFTWEVNTAESRPERIPVRSLFSSMNALLAVA